MELKGETNVKNMIGYESDIHKTTEFELYILWKSLPPLMKNALPNREGTIPRGSDIARALGIEDETLIELSDIKTQKDFARVYNLHVNTLGDWNIKIREKGLSLLPDMREWASGLSRNLLMSTYQHAMKKGNPLLIKLWFQLIEQWEEKQQVEHKFIPVTEVIITQNDNLIPQKTTEVESNN